MSKFRSQAWRNEKGRVFLGVGAERELRKRDARGSGPKPELNDIRKNPEGGVSLIQEPGKGDLGCPRSAGCSSMYSAPASRAAVRIVVVRRTSSFASWSSSRWADGTSGKPNGCSRMRKTGGPPSGEAAALKYDGTPRTLSMGAKPQPP
eukprot:3410186-Pleurochrysis_carterae.AAC.1